MDSTRAAWRRRLLVRGLVLLLLAVLVVAVAVVALRPAFGTGAEFYAWLGLGCLVLLLGELGAFWTISSRHLFREPLGLIPTLMFWMLRIVNAMILGLSLVGIIAGFWVNPAAAGVGLVAWLVALGLHVDNWVVRLAWLLRPGARARTIRQPHLMVTITHALARVAARSRLAR